MTRRAFSEKHGIALSTLDYYLHRHRKSARRPVRLARVELSTVEPASRFTLVLSNGRGMECDEGGLARPACTSADCGFVLWDNPVPVVAALVECEGRVVLDGPLEDCLQLHRRGLKK